MATEQTIKKILAQFWIRFPQAKSNDPDTIALTIMAWMEDCADVPDEPLYQAAREYWMKKHDYMQIPNPGTIRERAIELTNGDANEKSMQAWQRFRDWDYGHGDSIADDPLIMKTIQRCGGADYIGNLETEKVENYVRREFLKLYAESFERQTTLALPTGATNVPVMIGAAAQKLTLWSKGQNARTQNRTSN